MRNYLLLFTVLINLSTYTVIPYLNVRSQSANTARELAGADWNKLFSCGKKAMGLSVIPEYTESFRPTLISTALFGQQCNFVPCLGAPDGCNPCNNKNLTGIKLTGSQAPGRTTSDWLADYFGLPPDYNSCLSFEPRISNYLVDILFYTSLCKPIERAYFKLNVPIVNTRWDLNFQEFKWWSFTDPCRYERKGYAPYWPGYFSPSLATQTVGINRDDLTYNLETFMCMNNVPFDVNITFEPLSSAKLCCSKLDRNGISDIQTSLGYHIACNDFCNIAAGMIVGVPTGTRPTGQYLFEPTIGNGKHWQLGVELLGNWKVFNTCSCERSIDLCLEAHITHLFKTHQCRTFDICGKPLSRFMLACKFNNYSKDLYYGQSAGSLKASAQQFSGTYAPVANLTTIPVHSSIPIEVDATLMLQYTVGNCSGGIGYNLWAQSRERISYNTDCPTRLCEQLWALKGDAFMYGYEKNIDDTLSETAIPLSTTQSGACLNRGTNRWPTGFDNLAWAQNPGIDNPSPAWTNGGKELYVNDVLSGEIKQVYTSIEPEFLSIDSLDFKGACTRGISHKFFAHFDYTYVKSKQTHLSIGIGGEVEIGQHERGNDCVSNCDLCEDLGYSKAFAPSQWGLWIKAGFSIL